MGSSDNSHGAKVRGNAGMAAMGGVLGARGHRTPPLADPLIVWEVNRAVRASARLGMVEGGWGLAILAMPRAACAVIAGAAERMIGGGAHRRWFRCSKLDSAM